MGAVVRWWWSPNEDWSPRREGRAVDRREGARRAVDRVGRDVVGVKIRHVGEFPCRIHCHRNEPRPRCEGRTVDGREGAATSPRDELGRIPSRTEGEPLNALVVGIRDKDIAAACIHADTLRRIKLAIARTRATPGCKEQPSAGEFFYPVVVSIIHINIPGSIHRNPLWTVEQAIFGAEPTPFQEEVQTAVELLNAMVIRI